MSLPFPYTYISCPCSDESNRALSSQRRSRDLSQENEAVEEEKTFDPHHPRSNYSLFPPEYLLYCEECHEIKCPRCVTEEIVCWYCPSCLFETPSSMVRSEGNRCARNCFNCPICTSQLTVNTLTDAKEGPWILNCNYCMWTSLEIGIKFDKPTNIRSQLDKTANGGKPKPSSKTMDFADPSSRTSSLARDPISPNDVPIPHPENPQPEQPLDPVARFAALKSFYKTQISLSSGTDPASTLPSAADIAYSSPSSLTRIVNLYTNLAAAKKPKTRAHIMREALTPAEGLLVALPPLPPPPDDIPHPSPFAQITHISETASLAQKSFQQSASGSGNPHARLVSDLRPMPALLRTKRAKRCAACKHILVKPEFKPTSTRYRIKLTALNYIPLVTLKFVAPPPPPTTTLAGMRPGGGGGGGELAPTKNPTLLPHRPYQWVLTLKNHLFDAVKVSLGTPAVTPGKLGHRVTVLCPQFDVGANSDVWDDALGGGEKRGSVVVDDRTKARALNGEFGVAEAGKVYDKGRNWTSVVLEVVPVAKSAAARSGRNVVVGVGVLPSIGAEVVDGGAGRQGQAEGGVGQEEGNEEDGVEEDSEDDVVEIPVRVRLEWRQSDADEGAEERTKTKTKSTRVNEDGAMEDTARRELAYWMVLGVGRVGGS